MGIFDEKSSKFVVLATTNVLDLDIRDFYLCMARIFRQNMDM